MPLATPRHCHRARFTLSAARALAPMLLVLVSGLAAGCGSSSTVIEEGAVYPAGAQQGALDVQSFRDETQLAIINTSERAFGPSRLWINQWYSREIDGLGVGQKITLDLYTFKDRYGTAFRAGGFFATDRPDRVALLQIEETGATTGLISVGQTE